MKSPLVPVVLAFLFAAASNVRAATAVLAPVADTTLFEVTPNNNMGRSSLVVGAVGDFGSGGAGRALLRFDLSSISSDAVITAAALNFFVFKESFAANPSSFQLHRFLKPWTEGTGSGNTGFPAQPGETTWLSQFHGSALWSQPGSASGTEYASAASSSVDILGLGAYSFASTAELVADVQGWVSGTATNHGWIMISTTEDTRHTARRISPREDPSSPPRLEVQYTESADPMPRISSAAATDGGFELRFTVPSTYCYEVQYRDSLSVAPSWLALTNVCAPMADVQAIASDSISHPQRFYRLRISGRVR